MPTSQASAGTRGFSERGRAHETASCLCAASAIKGAPSAAGSCSSKVEADARQDRRPSDPSATTSRSASPETILTTMHSLPRHVCERQRLPFPSCAEMTRRCDCNRARRQADGQRNSPPANRASSQRQNNDSKQINAIVFLPASGCTHPSQRVSTFTLRLFDHRNAIDWKNLLVETLRFH
jgi:hypothetical protein